MRSIISSIWQPLAYHTNIAYSEYLNGTGRICEGARMPAPKEIQTLCQNFRHHLEFFFAHLNLAPPYHTVEKAIAHLTSLLKALPAEKLEETSRDLAQQWEFYQQAFIESGLNQKHRGIIAGMIRRGEADTLPEEYQPFLKTYLS